jgi:membrane protease YdiL (CAAX protease family)
LVAKLTNAFSFVEMNPISPQHTYSFLKFCLVVTLYEWFWFLIAWSGIRSRGVTMTNALIGERWNSKSVMIRDVGLGLLAFGALLALAVLAQIVLAPYEHDTAQFTAMIPQNKIEALGFLAMALTAGFVEEFVFRGYVQIQLTALVGNTVLASIIQVLLFAIGHYYQGLVRMVSVAISGTVLTAFALWRKSLKPSMIGHGLGDSLVVLTFLARHLR